MLKRLEKIVVCEKNKNWNLLDTYLKPGELFRALCAPG